MQRIEHVHMLAAGLEREGTSRYMRLSFNETPRYNWLTRDVTATLVLSVEGGNMDPFSTFRLEYLEGTGKSRRQVSNVNFQVKEGSDGKTQYIIPVHFSSEERRVDLLFKTDMVGFESKVHMGSCKLELVYRIDYTPKPKMWLMAYIVTDFVMLFLFIFCACGIMSLGQVPESFHVVFCYIIISFVWNMHKTIMMANRSDTL